MSTRTAGTVNGRATGTVAPGQAPAPRPDQGTPEVEWYRLAPAEVASRLEVDVASGLSADDAQEFRASELVPRRASQDRHVVIGASAPGCFRRDRNDSTIHDRTSRSPANLKGCCRDD